MRRPGPFGWAVLLAMGFTAEPRLAVAQAPSDSAALAASMWAAQTEPRAIWLGWDHVPGPTSYVVSCVIGRRTSPRVISTVSAPRAVAKVATAPPKRLFSAVIVRDPGEPHRCFLEWGRDVKTGSVNRVAFNEVVPVVPTEDTKDAPASVTARATGVGEITVTWGAVPGATAYSIGRAVRPEGFRVHCNLCSTRTTYVDRYAKPGATHTYTVNALTASGPASRATSNTVLAPATESAVAAQGDATVNPDIKPLSSVTAAVAGATTALVTWDRAPAAAAYEVLRSLNGGSLAPLGRVRAGIDQRVEYSDYLASGAGTRARYAVKVVDSSGNTTAATTSNEITLDAKAATTIGTSPTQPTNLRAAFAGTDTVMLGWRPPGNAIPCTIRRRTSGGAYATLRALAAGTSQYVDTMTGIAGMRPQYELACGDAKSAMTTVAFPNPI